MKNKRFTNPLEYIGLGILIGIVIGVFMVLVMIAFDLGNVIENNGFMKVKDCAELHLSLNVDIPDSSMIKNFCITKGFKYGWLSSTACGKNEVQCYRDVGELSEYKCLRFEYEK